MVPFESFGMVSYLYAIVTMAVSCIVSEIKQDIGRNRDFSYPAAFDAPRQGSPRQNIAMPFGVEKLEWCGCQTVKKFDDTFSHFDRILVCDRQTDGHLETA